MKTKFFFLLAAVLLSACTMISLIACSKSESEEGIEPFPTPTPTPAEQIPINISLGLSTRATDSSFEQGDCVGVYIVNYDGTQPGTFQNKGNHVDNHKLSYTGRWVSDETVYWKDETTHADFYAYYPYRAEINNVSSMPFSTSTDQSSYTNYTASDLLWGKVANQAPTSDPIYINTRHLMSSAVIKLVAGDGFTATSLSQANPQVTINGVKTEMSFDLTKGEFTVTGQATSVTPYHKQGVWYAHLVPQTVSDSGFITVKIDGRNYRMSKDFTLESGKRHQFTVTVNKTSAGINVGITAWDTDDVDNGGVAE